MREQGSVGQYRFATNPRAASAVRVFELMNMARLYSNPQRTTAIGQLRTAEVTLGDDDSAYFECLPDIAFIIGSSTSTV